MKAAGDEKTKGRRMIGVGKAVLESKHKNRTGAV